MSPWRTAELKILTSCTAGPRSAFSPTSPPARTTSSNSWARWARYDVPHHFTPDVALLEVAAAALSLACPPGSDPLEYEGLTDRYLPDQMLTGRTLRHRTHYAIHAAACLRGGLLPDLLSEAGGWEPRLWTYAVSAVVLYTRAAADRLGETVPEIAVKMAGVLGLELSADSQSID